MELVEHDAKIFREILRRKVRLALGASISVAHAAFFLRRTDSMVFNDDDAQVVKPFVKLGYPFADWVVTPRCLNEKHGPRHVTHDSYHVLSYLHPNHFTPDPAVLSELGVAPEEKIFLLRFVSLSAFHDTQAVGLSFAQKLELIEFLKSRGRVFISCEGKYPAEFQSMMYKADPIKMHSFMSFCNLVVGDSQTMTAEAAVMGVPAIRCNTFVGRISYLEELEHRYGLTFGFRPEHFENALAKIKALLEMENLKEKWQGKRAKMLAEKVDLAKWIYDFIKEKYLP